MNMSHLGLVCFKTVIYRYIWKIFIGHRHYFIVIIKSLNKEKLTASLISVVGHIIRLQIGFLQYIVLLFSKQERNYLISSSFMSRCISDLNFYSCISHLLQRGRKVLMVFLNEIVCFTICIWVLAVSTFHGIQFPREWT